MTGVGLDNFLYAYRERYIPSGLARPKLEPRPQLAAGLSCTLGHTWLGGGAESIRDNCLASLAYTQAPKRPGLQGISTRLVSIAGTLFISWFGGCLLLVCRFSIRDHAHIRSITSSGYFPSTRNACCRVRIIILHSSCSNYRLVSVIRVVPSYQDAWSGYEFF